MRDNKGFTLIEAIVVIAILAVLAAAASIAGTALLASWRVTNCSSDISSALKETKINAMSKSSAYMEIRYDSSKKAYYLEETGAQGEKIASGGITITYVTNQGDSISITDGAPLILSYNRSSGAFQPIITSVGNDGSFTFLTSGSTKIYCQEIIISNGSKTKTITLMKDTGKHTLD